MVDKKVAWMAAMKAATTDMNWVEQKVALSAKHQDLLLDVLKVVS